MNKKIFFLFCFFLVNSYVYADGFNDYIHFGNANNIYNITHNIKFKAVVKNQNDKIAAEQLSSEIKPGAVTEISEKYFGVKIGTIDFYIEDATALSGYKRCIFNYPFAPGVGIIIQGWGENDNISCNIDDVRNG